jgi:hypothetical protein
MFIAFSYLNPGQLIVLGLSKENRKRLDMGQPIFIERKTHGLAIPENLKICIFSGETEETMKKQFADLIGPTTIVDQMKPD